MHSNDEGMRKLCITNDDDLLTAVRRQNKTTDSKEFQQPASDATAIKDGHQPQRQHVQQTTATCEVRNCLKLDVTIKESKFYQKASTNFAICVHFQLCNFVARIMPVAKNKNEIK